MRGKYEKGEQGLLKRDTGPPIGHKVKMLYFVLFGDFIFSYPPGSETRREVANLTERKNPHTPVYAVCDKV